MSEDVKDICKGLRDALKTYGRHIEGCPATFWFQGDKLSCSCGFDDVFAALVNQGENQ
jgi:hypothetical protein